MAVANVAQNMLDLKISNPDMNSADRDKQYFIEFKKYCEKYDYLFENAQRKITFNYPRCKAPVEWLRIYWLFLLVPIGTGFTAWIIT